MTTQTHTDDGIPAFLDRSKDTKAAVAISPAKKAELASPDPKPAKVKAAKAAKVVKAKTKKADEQTAPKQNPRSIVPVKFKTQYAATNDTCGSKLALALKEATTTTNEDGRECLDVAALKTIAAANGVEFSKYEKLNNGQKRMNVGNRLVGLVKNGTTVVIGKQRFADPSKALQKQASAA